LQDDQEQSQKSGMFMLTPDEGLQTKKSDSKNIKYGKGNQFFSIQEHSKDS
jgi:hypothetical protein